MGFINIPQLGQKVAGVEEVRSYLNARGIRYEVWETPANFTADSTPEEVLEAYRTQIDSLKKEGDYRAADVISVNEQTEGIEKIREIFLREHTHSEDEVRFFVEGKGLFWFNLGGDSPIFSLLCQSGDLISVPAGVCHWFDLGANPCVKAIRIFTNPSGWVANYTGSGVDERYNPKYH